MDLPEHDGEEIEFTFFISYLCLFLSKSRWTISHWLMKQLNQTTYQCHLIVLIRFYWLFLLVDYAEYSGIFYL